MLGVCVCVCVCPVIAPAPGAAVMIMAIWARSLSSSLSSAVILSRAVGSAACLARGPTFMAAVRAGAWHLATFWFRALSFLGGKWFLWITKLLLHIQPFGRMDQMYLPITEGLYGCNKVSPYTWFWQSCLPCPHTPRGYQQMLGWLSPWWIQCNPEACWSTLGSEH